MNDPGLEQSLLAAVLFDAATLDEVADLFRPDLFSEPRHRAIAEELLELQAAGKALDPVLVISSLTAKGKGSAAELVGPLVRSIGTALGARSYAERLRSMWISREARRIASEVIEQGGAASGEEVLGSALQKLGDLERGSSPAGGAKRVGEVIMARLDQLEAQAKNPEAPPDCYPTGFERLDYLVGGVRRGVPMLLAARPSQGKSALAVALADNLSAAGVKVGIFQLEDESASFADRMVIRRAKVNGTLLRHGANLRTEHWDRIMTAANPLMEAPCWVDDTHGLTSRDLCARMRKMRRELGIQIFFVDHVGEIVLEGDDRHDIKLGRAVRQLRDAAHRLDVGLVLFHQMNRGVEQRKEGGEPRLSDLKDSGDLEAIARVVGFLSLQGSGRFCIDVAKNTHGPCGRVVLDWLEDYAAIMQPRGYAP